MIDNKKIYVSSFFDSDWNIDVDLLKERLDLLKYTEAKFFKMRLSTLKKMATEEKTMSALYEKLIELAKVPDEVTERYCLLFKFNKESV